MNRIAACVLAGVVLSIWWECITLPDGKLVPSIWVHDISVEEPVAGDSPAPAGVRVVWIDPKQVYERLYPCRTVAEAVQQRDRMRNEWERKP